MSFNLDYFYGNETDQFRFYRIPKALFNEDISLEAVTLYGLMMDRVSLSIQNGWTDDQGRVYIYFVQTDVQKRLRCGHNRATTFMRELEAFGLIERKRQGLGKPAKIYVKNFTASEMADCTYSETVQKDAADRNQKSAFSSAPNGAPTANQRSVCGGERRKECSGRSPLRQAGTKQSGIFSDDAKTARNEWSGVPTAGSLECPNQAANDTEKKETEFIETNPILPQPPRTSRKPFQPQRTPAEQMDEMRLVREEIRENIDYEGLIWDHPYDQNMIDGYVELMVEAACSTKETVRICGQDILTALVRSRFLKLNQEHIEYVRDCLSNVKTFIGNIKAYTLAALYNSPVTIEQYYASLVSRDFYLSGQSE